MDHDSFDLRLRDRCHGMSPIAPVAAPFEKSYAVEDRAWAVRCRQGQHPFLASGHLQPVYPLPLKADRHDASLARAVARLEAPARLHGFADYVESCGGKQSAGRSTEVQMVVDDQDTVRHPLMLPDRAAAGIVEIRK
jgi:hypothetical protein